MRYFRTFSLLFLMFLVGSTSITELNAQTISEIYFGDGVLLNKNSNDIYFANEKSIVEAADLKSGAKKWTTKIKGKPILIINNELYVLITDDTFKPTLNFAVLDVANNGNQIAEFSTSIQNKEFKKSGRLDVQPYKVGNDNFIVWFYHPPLREVYQKEDDAKMVKGAFYVTERSLKPLAMKELPKGYNQNPIIVSKNERIEHKNENRRSQQFYSRDKRHILVSSFKSKPGIIKNYIWRIYDRSTKKNIGMMESNVSYTPFVVDESNLIFVQNAYQIINNKNTTSFPKQLIWYDLKNAKEIQAIPILDSSFKESSL